MNIAADKKELMRRRFPPALVEQRVVGGGRKEDFVGHAAVTDRLQAVDEDWTFTVDREFEHGNEFWIRGTLTLGGVSRPEYGRGKNPLEAASHFIRRAAMRFGVALDLWSKEELLEASSSPARASDPESPSRSQIDGGRDGDNRGEGVEEPAGTGEGPTGSTPEPHDKADLSYHENTPHRLAPAPDFPGYLMCTKGKCPYWEYVGKTEVTA